MFVVVVVFLPIYLLSIQYGFHAGFNVSAEYTIASVCLFVGFIFRFVFNNFFRFCRILFSLILVFLFGQVFFSFLAPTLNLEFVFALR